MGAESGWAAAVGAAAGMLGWVVGLGGVLWPQHPQLALLFIAGGVAIVSSVILNRNHRKGLQKSAVRLGG
jgi:hypothetical protein